jgi:hypothetical protein
MPTHNIIDNRNQKLIDHIKRIPTSTKSAVCGRILLPFPLVAEHSPTR